MKTYRVAILGCRSRGTATAEAYHVHPRTAVVGLCDLVEERLNKLGDEIGVSARFANLLFIFFNQSVFGYQILNLLNLL